MFVINIESAYAEESARQSMEGEYKGVYSEKTAKSMAVTVAKNKARKYCDRNGWRQTKGFQVEGTEAASYGTNGKMYRGTARITFYCALPKR